MSFVLWGLGAGVVALAYSAFIASGIMRRPSGSARMQEVARAISDGSSAYLNRQLASISVFAAALGVVLWLLVSPVAAISFVFGAGLSYLAAFVGMNVSVRANVRTAEAAKSGLSEALGVAFRGGSVTGLMVAGLAVAGVAITVLMFSGIHALIGLGLGASLVSLFARVGGGIYTKAADVGADLVGKVEKGIPEDDPRNPAVIADNVGDNVGDCAGMGADLFESFVVTMVAAMLLALAAMPAGADPLQQTLFTLPLLVGGIGVVSSVVGSNFVSLGRSKNIMRALDKGVYATVVLFAGLLYVAGALIGLPMAFYLACLTGLALTVVVGKVTEYYTSKENAPVRSIAEASGTGAGTNLIAGTAVGMQSTFLPVIAIVIAMLLSYYFAGVYGIALAAVAMLATTGIIVAVDSYGPITDNAGGIAEMSGLPSSVREVTDSLDAVGNTTKATTKGFAIASAALSALSLFAAYAAEAGIVQINVLDPRVVAGLFIGGLLPFLFSSMLMKAVGKAAHAMVEEVRRQFRTIKGLMQGKAKPDYARCVDISTQGALKELLAPAVLAVASPLVVGFLLGPVALGGLLAGAIISGLLLALYMANAGAAWDNAKKLIESGKRYGGKGSFAHSAAVVGDTVGDPFKDTAGPALNALIKVLNTVSLIAAGMIVRYSFALL